MCLISKIDYVSLILGSLYCRCLLCRQIWLCELMFGRGVGSLTGRGVAFVLSRMASERLELAFTLFVSITLKRVNMSGLVKRKFVVYFINNFATSLLTDSRYFLSLR